MATIKVSTYLHVLYFAGNMPFSEATLKNLPGYVGFASTDSILLADTGRAILASTEAFHPFEKDAEDRRQCENDARADMRTDADQNEKDWQDVDAAKADDRALSPAELEAEK